MSASNLKSL